MTEFAARKIEAHHLGYSLVAGTDADELHAIARLQPRTPATIAACKAQGADAVYAECAFLGDDARDLAILEAVNAALNLARTIH